jgi:hypothetical protein
MEGESKAEETKRVAACRFAVANNRNAAIDDEPSSTGTVRLRVLSTSTRGSCSAMARTIALLGQGRWFASYGNLRIMTLSGCFTLASSPKTSLVHRHPPCLQPSQERVGQPQRPG